MEMEMKGGAGEGGEKEIKNHGDYGVRERRLLFFGTEEI
jgi:hypothetical protein